MLPKGSKSKPTGIPEKDSSFVDKGKGFENKGDDRNHHSKKADSFFRGLDANDAFEFDSHQEAVRLLYHTDEAILGQLYQELRLAGGHRPGIRYAVERALQASRPGVVYTEDQLDAIIIATKQEMNHSHPHFEAMIRNKRKQGQYTQSLEDRGWAKNLKEDEKTRQDFGRALIIFISLKKDQPLIPTSAPKKPAVKMGQVVEAFTLSPKELCYSQICDLVGRGKDLSSVTRAINKAGKGGDIWVAIESPLLALGITLPTDRQERVEAVTSAFGTTELSFAAFMQEKWPDPGEAIGLREIQRKKWSPLQTEIATLFMKDFKLKIPVVVSEVLLEVYNKKLESTAMDEGMKNHLKHAEKMPHKIIVETGATALAHFVRHYNRTKETPTIQEWIDALLLAQNERPDLALGEDGKYHYQKAGADFESMIAKAGQLEDEELA